MDKVISELSLAEKVTLTAGGFIASYSFPHPPTPANELLLSIQESTSGIPPA